MLQQQLQEKTDFYCFEHSGQMKSQDDSGSHQLHQLLLVLDELHGSLVRSVHQLSDLLVDQLGRRLAVRLLHHHLALPGQVERHLSHLIAHPKLHHLVRREKQTSQRETLVPNQTGAAGVSPT